MKEWTCEHCVKNYTDACYMGYIADGYKYCQDDILVDKDVAYEQGRADAEKELQGLKDLGKFYSEIRTEVIDDCIYILELFCTTNNFKGITKEDIRGVLEQLKE